MLSTKRPKQIAKSKQISRSNKGCKMTKIYYAIFIASALILCAVGGFYVFQVINKQPDPKSVEEKDIVSVNLGKYEINIPAPKN
jgi:hypothetical protein